ncbi:hypothetical protein LFAB_16905 [Lactiplantibacillus fabifermentans T30PCM01]|uniref:Extracellular protein n=1 Tax=Lactiplantibacillus fabifermentans T30PCM01 TaxID=1400520 RepID=W6TBF6_9LACO|nr:hypothetical protein [Lactiplantibacillus fabifermentans]ETY72555.1 hypothetical protein LFAB_16905 [Lactiplantibacillus fabifermentans T30PCM01]
MKQSVKAMMTAATVMLAVTGITAINGQASTKSVKQLPARLTKTTWYRQTDGYSGGYNDKSNFKGNLLHFRQGNGVNFNWKFSNIKQTSKNVYYAKMNYPNKKLMPVKIVIRNDKRFNIIPQRMYGIAKNFGGTENYGAIIFTAKKAAKTTKVTPKAKKTFTVKAPTGTWKSNTANKYRQVWTFSQKKGFNSYLYKNGKKVKTLVAYGNYRVKETSRNVWKLTYRPNGSKKWQTVYLRFTAKNKLQLVNSKNKVINVKVGVAPAAKWTFTKA